MASQSSRALLTHTKRWVLVDAAHQPVGRLAAQLSMQLQGKTKPIYHPTTTMGDNIVVINADKVQFSGKKWDDKLYRWHTGWPGGFRERTARDMHARKPTEVLRKAVNGMLPKNKLRRRMMDQLFLIEGDKHPYGMNVDEVLQPAQLPVPPLPRLFVEQNVVGDEPPPDGYELGESVTVLSGEIKKMAN